MNKRIYEFSEKTFFVKICSDSLLPKIKAGDVVMVDPERDLEEGFLCYCSSLEGQIIRIVRRYHVDDEGTITLTADNPEAGGPIIITKEERGRYEILRVIRALIEM
jgi:phage repressor protein C with HTH and peptisase S24 domain